jgi:16S rRNA (guanine527-N7)-methyltransferase
MNADEIADMLRPFLGSHSLSNDQLSRVAIYLEQLLKWNAKINLTAIRGPEDIVARHFGESFLAARHLLLEDKPPSSAIDIGSGAGFPGLPMKIWFPNLALTLIESNGKKATFLREVCRALDLGGVEVISERAEDIRAQADLVTLRAVERFESILAVAQRLLKPAGILALLIGRSQGEVAKRQLPDLRWQPVVPVPESQSRILLVGSKKDNS